MSRRIVCDSCGTPIEGSNYYRLKAQRREWNIDYNSWRTEWAHLCGMCWEAHKKHVLEWKSGVEHLLTGEK